MKRNLQNRVGKCCSGLDCKKTSESAVAQTCNRPAITTTAAATTAATATTTTATAVPTTTTSEAATTTEGIAVQTTTATTTTSSKCLTTSGAVSGVECQFPFVFQGQVMSYIDKILRDLTKIYNPQGLQLMHYSWRIFAALVFNWNQHFWLPYQQ